MGKTFTLAEAQTLLPVLEALLRRAQSSARRLVDLEGEMQRLSHRIFLSGGMHVNVAAAARRRAEHLKAAQESKDSVAEIEAIGVTVEDFEGGVLDLPCVVDGRTVMLCWRTGETTITHWHEEAEGMGERRPVEMLFGKSERERLN